MIRLKKAHYSAVWFIHDGRDNQTQQTKGSCKQHNLKLE